VEEGDVNYDPTALPGFIIRPDGSEVPLEHATRDDVLQSIAFEESFARECLDTAEALRSFVAAKWGDA